MPMSLNGVAFDTMPASTLAAVMFLATRSTLVVVLVAVCPSTYMPES